MKDHTKDQVQDRIQYSYDGLTCSVYRHKTFKLEIIIIFCILVKHFSKFIHFRRKESVDLRKLTRASFS
jgi:diacylglycerol kinase